MAKPIVLNIDKFIDNMTIINTNATETAKQVSEKVSETVAQTLENLNQSNNVGMDFDQPCSFRDRLDNLEAESIPPSNPVLHNKKIRV